MIMADNRKGTARYAGRDLEESELLRNGLSSKAEDTAVPLQFMSSEILTQVHLETRLTMRHC